MVLPNGNLPSTSPSNFSIERFRPANWIEDCDPSLGLAMDSLPINQCRSNSKWHNHKDLKTEDVSTLVGSLVDIIIESILEIPVVDERGVAPEAVPVVGDV